ncbi:GFA family protein [Alkalimarinus coralli]|uniref:GFA family protein n=1 Tax=Alkalimarinus coralli TaxID=2935863 RepID=UPI00202ACA72|nr:GFA family protein [Alkalimarinus coralli]
MIGRCLCGGIEYEVTGLSGNIYQCHCTLCRKQGGSSSNSGTVVPMSQLKWLKGEENVKTWTKETGFTSCFCQNCGSPVPNLLRKLAYYWVPIGTLEDGPFKIVANLYQGSKASWAVVSPTGEKFETMPGVQDFIELLGNELHE